MINEITESFRHLGFVAIHVYYTGYLFKVAMISSLYVCTVQVDFGFAKHIALYRLTLVLLSILHCTG